MAVIAPQTDVYLLKVPLEIDNANQLTFANATAQFNYFNSCPKLTVDDFTYQRKDGTIRFGANFDNLIGYNYVMYRNDAYSNKWFYAFIDNMQYMNDNMTAISISTDVWQTWQFSLTYKQCFVEREHVNDDTIGSHTVPENLELGDYVINDMRKIPMYQTGTASPDFLICFVVTRLPYDDAPWFDNPSNNIGGVFTSEYMFAVQNYTAARNVIKVYEERSSTTSEAIQNMYMIPAGCVDQSTGVSKVWSSSSVSQGVYIYPILQQGWTSDKYTLEEPKTLNGYSPKNAKMYTYPFSYFYIDNNAGTSVDYRWEDFPNATSEYWSTYHPKVEYYKAVIPSASMSSKLFFENYKKYPSTTGSRCFNYGISFGKIPICAWTTDYYTNWLTQNGVNTGLGLATGILQGGLGMAGGFMFGNPISIASGAVGIASAIGGTIAEQHKASTVPPQAHGDTNTGDFSYAYDRCSMNFYMMSVRYEFAKICDDYMSMFGYKVNTVKTPNVTGRRNWNYVKTIGCYIEANIPQDDLQEIKSMFDRGVTFWHNPSTFCDYTATNDII